jgi:hypothetical protein
MRIEAAMVLAGAYWSEGNYGAFHDTLEIDIVQKYPMLLPVRTWEVSGLICDGKISEATSLVQTAETPHYWKEFQLGRIFLARGDNDDKRIAAKHFDDAIATSPSHNSIEAWAYVGKAIATGTNPNSVPGAKSAVLWERLFRTPGQCPH